MTHVVKELIVKRSTKGPQTDESGGLVQLPTQPTQQDSRVALASVSNIADCSDLSYDAAYTVCSQQATVDDVESIRSGWETLRRRELRELAILIDPVAAVRVWLDRSGPDPRVIVEDLDRGDYTSLNAVALSDLIPKDRAIDY